MENSTVTRFRQNMAMLCCFFISFLSPRNPYPTNTASPRFPKVSKENKHVEFFSPKHAENSGTFDPLAFPQFVPLSGVLIAPILLMTKSPLWSSLKIYWLPAMGSRFAGANLLVVGFDLHKQIVS